MKQFQHNVGKRSRAPIEWTREETTMKEKATMITKDESDSNGSARECEKW